VVYGEDYIEKELRDAWDVQLFSTIYVGNRSKSFDVIFDTGSGVSSSLHIKIETFNQNSNTSYCIVDLGPRLSVHELPHQKQIRHQHLKHLGPAFVEPHLALLW
jgi:hypothetical protein